MTSSSEQVARRKRLAEAMHLQAMEGNAPDAEDIAMFDMFEREGWSDERRLSYIMPDAAE